MIIGALLCSVCIGIMAILAGVHGYSYSNATLLQPSSVVNMQQSGSNPFYLTFDANGPTIGFLIVMYFTVAVYSCTWGTLGWIYPTELYSQGVRAKALGISTASNWLFTLAVLQLSPIMLEYIHWVTYLLFSIFCLIIALVVHNYFPETNVCRFIVAYVLMLNCFYVG
jgi:hypothetical protein